MNRACLQRTVFVEYKNKEKSFGYRIYDDYSQDYCNTMTEDDLKLSDQEFLDKCKKSFSEVSDLLFESALEHGIYIDDDWYTFDLRGVPLLIKLED